MKRMALVTLRLPHARLARLEQGRRALATFEGRSDVFTFATCQRALACTLAEDPDTACEELVDALTPAGWERYVGMDAIAHLARVAASLDALVPGEDQVPAQFREQLSQAQDELDAELLERLQRVRSLARQARDAGGLTGHASRSILDLAEPLLPDEGPLALLGTGTIAAEARQALDEDRTVHVVSREPTRATELSDDDEHAWSRKAFLSDPPPLAGVLLCTRSPEAPVLDEAAGHRLADARPGEDAVQIVDLAVPRNADPALAHIGGLRLSDVEDLARIAAARPERDARVEQARQALEQRLATERRRRGDLRLDERVVALREGLAEELAELADQRATDGREDWLQEAHGRLAHTAQAHLEAAAREEEPP